MTPERDSSTSFDFPRLSALLERVDDPMLAVASPVIDELFPHVEPIITIDDSFIPDADRSHRARETPDSEIDEIEEMIERMHMRDVAREALRARMIAFGEGRQHRTTYESVFLMLAFAVMVLVAAPPLIDILLAARGIKP